MGGIFSSSSNNSTKKNIQKNTQIPFDLEKYVISEDILQKNGLKGYYLKFNNKRKLPVIENFKDKTDYIKNNSNVKYISIVPMNYTIETISKISKWRERDKKIQDFIKYIKQQKNVIFISINHNLQPGATNSNFNDYKIIKEKFINIEGIDNYYETKFIFENNEKKSIKEKAWKLYGIKENNKKNNKRINNN
jgi:hypothetical protein